jgi:hypothetical protein
MPEQSNRPALAKFSRDVLINVIANLVAAAVIYLIGALVGFFPRNPALISGAIIGVLLVGGLILLSLGGDVKTRSEKLAAGIGFICLGLATLGMGIWPIVTAARTHQNPSSGGWFQIVFFVVGGIGEITLAVTLYLRGA